MIYSSPGDWPLGSTTNPPWTLPTDHSPTWQRDLPGLISLLTRDSTMVSKPNSSYIYSVWLATTEPLSLVQVITRIGSWGRRWGWRRGYLEISYVDTWFSQGWWSQRWWQIWTQEVITSLKATHQPPLPWPHSECNFRKHPSRAKDMQPKKCMPWYLSFTKASLVTFICCFCFSTSLGSRNKRKSFYPPGPQPYLMSFESIMYNVGLCDPSDHPFIHQSRLPSFHPSSICIFLQKCLEWRSPKVNKVLHFGWWGLGTCCYFLFRMYWLNLYSDHLPFLFKNSPFVFKKE